jgi:serine/threonine protein kinase
VDEEFGRYRLLGLIGEGAMGKVYKAHDSVIGRDVAIKILPIELGAEPGYRERFRREAHTAARLTEPHIIPIHDTGEIDGHLYLVMPVIEGTDVHSLLKGHGPMSPQRAVTVITQLAAALDAAHQHGLVHRDIKPSNALITGDDFVYLIDFGIAHDAAATRLTNTGMMVGTLAYMAPERFTAGTADARADIYALACVLHECLTGTTPYPGDSIEQQIAGHLTLDPPQPSILDRAIPSGFDEVIATGMAKKPDQRYQNARDLATAAHHAVTQITTPHTLLDSTQPPPAPTAPHDQQPPPPHTTQPPPGPEQPAGVHRAATRLRPIGDAARAAYTQQAQRADHLPGGRTPPSPHGLEAPHPDPGHHKPSWPLIGAGIGLLLVAAIAAAIVIPASMKSRTSTATSVLAPAAQESNTATSTTAPVVAKDALQGLLLSPDQINTAMGVTGLVVAETSTAMDGDNDITQVEQACLPLYQPGEAPAYAHSGWTALRVESLTRPGAGLPMAVQYAVLLPSANDANAFFTASAQSWQACSNRQYTWTGTGAVKGMVVWSVGPVSNVNGTLSATETGKGEAGSITCQRALTVANNIVIDINVCENDPSNVAVTIAHQIAAKVPT